MKTLRDDISETKAIQELSEKLNLPVHFFSKLRDEDDWSFIIKLHAFIEAAVTQLLSYHFAEPKLIEIFSRLEMSNPSVGKIAFLKDTELLGQEYRRYIVSLSELRNKFAHNVQYCLKTLPEIIVEYDKKQIETFAWRFRPTEAFLLRMSTSPKAALLKIARPDVKALIEKAKKDPKKYIWFGAYTLIIHMSEMQDFSASQQFTKALKVLKEDSVGENNEPLEMGE
jgi:hypothetical protein